VQIFVFRLVQFANYRRSG